jgi:signal transduction histidine kinase
LTDDGWRVRKDGTRFWAHVFITPLYDGKALRGFAKVTRDDTAPRAAAGRGRALQEITRGLLLGTETGDVLTIISRHARQLTGAAMVWIAMPEGPTFVVRAADGPVTGPQIGTRLRGDAGMVAVMADSRPVAVDDLAALYPAVPEVSSCGAGLVVPLLAGDGVTGVLVAAAPAGASPFQAADLELLQVFAKQAELVLSYGRAQQALRGQQVADDRERIARDLHDHVIQQLFATGLGLQGTAMRMTQAEERSHIEDAVERLDQTIRQVRTTVFDLHERDPHATAGARASIAALVRDAGRALGFQPTLQFRGVIDSAAPASTWDQAFAALREMLSNVARHAAASAVEVFVAATDDLLLKVTDNGTGPPAHLVLGSGLGNLQGRASDLGGSFALHAATGQGAVASWRIPIS